MVDRELPLSRLRYQMDHPHLTAEAKCIFGTDHKIMRSSAPRILFREKSYLYRLSADPALDRVAKARTIASLSEFAVLYIFVVLYTYRQSV